MVEILDTTLREGEQTPYVNFTIDEKVEIARMLDQVGVDMIEAGVIDPTKVTRSALQNAASIAALLLTTEAVIADKPEKESAMPPMPPGGGMGGMGGMY